MDKYLIEDRVIFNCHHMTLTLADRTTELTANEADLLVMVLKGLATKAAVMQQLWGDKGLVVTDSSYHQLVRAVRARLEEHGISGTLIKTLPRHGLRFIGTAQPLDDAVPATEPPQTAKPHDNDEKRADVTSSFDDPAHHTVPPRHVPKRQRAARLIERTLLIGAVVWIGCNTWKITLLNKHFSGLLSALKQEAQHPAPARAASLALLSSIGVKLQPGERLYQITRGGNKWLTVCPGTIHTVQGRCKTYLAQDLP